MALVGKTVVVTGAAGYLGNCIVRQIIDAGAAEVRGIDLEASWERCKFAASGKHVQYNCDVRDGAKVASIVRGADAIVHTASYGMSGSAQLDKKTIQEVNVGGTQNVIDAAIQHGACVVYTSSYNVVFGGQIYAGGDERTSNYCDDLQVDEYSRTKAVAERLVINSSGITSMQSPSGKLRCASIRPAAIYGEEEDRHMPRIVSLIQRGFVKFNIGNKSDLVDWVHAENVARAHVLALSNLLKTASADGEAFFISDEHPINNFEFLRPVVEAIGGPSAFPTVYIPTFLMLLIAYVFEILFLSGSTRWIFDYIPLMTRAEVQKVGVTHYFSTVKARDMLGYAPVIRHPEGILRTAAHWRKKIMDK